MKTHPCFNPARLLTGALLIALAACRHPADPEVTPELPTNKVLLTYTGEIKDGEWIEIDGMPRMLHKMDTSEAFVVPGSGEIRTRGLSPTFSPEPDVQNLWVSQAMTLGAMTGRWWPAFKSNGLPPTSLFYRLTLGENNAGAYTSSGKSYKLSFDGVAEAQWRQWDGNRMLLEFEGFNKLTRLRLERTDGQPIRIRTSEGYAAKVEYH
ncbi:MAG: hypothetical protein MUC97_17530 [Bernardetiaceae bacterium]|nr:hypothetical protein [Bernardetiaceae bacterium]